MSKLRSPLRPSRKHDEPRIDSKLKNRIARGLSTPEMDMFFFKLQWAGDHRHHQAMVEMYLDDSQRWFSLLAIATFSLTATTYGHCCVW